LLFEAKGLGGSAVLEDPGRSVEGPKDIIGARVEVVDKLLEGQWIVGSVAVDGNDRSVEGEENIIVDEVNETISLDSKGLIGGRKVTEGCLVDG
jgi:hypothetical protein